jgi:hypothetical protein
LGGDLNFEGKTALHLATANGDIRSLKVPLYPADPGTRKEFLEGSGHTWRRMQQKVDAKGDSFATFRAMEKQTLSYAKSTVGVPSFSGQETFLQFL